MRIDKALEQISEIHEHLAKSQVYRGYKAIPSMLAGVLAFVAAAVQPLFMQAEGMSAMRFASRLRLDPMSGDGSGPYLNPYPYLYVLYWSLIAVAAFCIAGGSIVHGFIREKDPHARRRTITVVGQLAPSLAIGAFATIVLAFEARANVIAYLPGIWAILYGLGWAASRPFLPKMIGWVTLFFLLSGCILLIRGLFLGLAGLSPWEVGLPFGIGQILGGLVLYWNLERKASITP